MLFQCHRGPASSIDNAIDNTLRPPKRMIFFVTQALMYQSKYSQNDFGTEDFARDHICTEILHDYCTCYSSITK